MALASILLLYLVIGLLAATGAITLGRRRFSARGESSFFALLLLPIASIYLAFLGYFGMPGALRVEGIAVASFALLALLGLRFAPLVPLAYFLHGGWDLLHELSAHLSVPGGTERSLTAIPLAYGVFCAAFDWLVAGYFASRLGAWREQREAGE